MRTPYEVKELFRISGTPVSVWARQHGFSVALVHRVLRGEAQCLRGKTHRIAVALGIKPAASAIQVDQIKQLMSQ